MPDDSFPHYRHLLQAAGLVDADDASVPARVVLTVREQAAATAATQHTAWLLTTLLTRSTTRVVSRVEVVCPTGVALQPGVVAGAATGTLADALAATPALFGPDASPVIVRDPREEHATPAAAGGPGEEAGQAPDEVGPDANAPVIEFIVGALPETAAAAARPDTSMPRPRGDSAPVTDLNVATSNGAAPAPLFVAGAGWTGALHTAPVAFASVPASPSQATRDETTASDDAPPAPAAPPTAGLLAVAPAGGGSTGPDAGASSAPVGPYIAACLAAAHVFLTVRGSDYTPTPVAFDGWQYAVTPLHATYGGGAVVVPTVDLPVHVSLDGHVLAGVGAVGTALLQTLWAFPGVHGALTAVDSDEEGVDVTNLQRCVLFQAGDLGQPKALVAAARLNGAERGGPDTLLVTGMKAPGQAHVDAQTHLISAVDTSEAREALQHRYPPSTVQASTQNLRVEVLRVNPAAGGPCLRCYNPPRQRMSDEAVRRLLDPNDAEAVAAHAAALNIAPAEVVRWAQSAPRCGQVDDAMRDRLRPADDADPAQFSVGFTSVLAGVLLAGQVVKDQMARTELVTVQPPPLREDLTRAVFTFLNPASALGTVRRFGRDSSCPSCQDGRRRRLWLQRWTG